MMKKYKLNCLAITNRLGKKVTLKNTKGEVNFLTKNDLSEEQISSYLESGHIVEVESSTSETENVEETKKRGRKPKAE